MTQIHRLLALPLLLASAGCSNAVRNEHDAALAYLGLDAGITRAMNLGLDGYNAASSANIDAQSAGGDIGGTMTVTGQVDQGSSDNKELRLEVALEGYLDDTVDGDTPFEVTYDSDPQAPLALDISLRDIPDGTLTGTFVGDVGISGDLGGIVSLDVALDGTIEAGVDDTVARTEGETHITGSATSDYGSYAIDLVR